MTIFHTAYDTAAGSPYNLKTIEEKLKVGQIKNSIPGRHIMSVVTDEEYVLDEIQGGSYFADDIPFFGHPLYSFENNGQMHVSVDTRNFGKYDTNQQKFAVRNRAEYNWTIMRAALNYVWIKGRIESLRDISTIPAQVYGTLISQSVARKYALDPSEQVQICAIASYFYQCLFVDSTKVTEEQKARMIGRAAQIAKIPVDTVTSLLDGVDVISGLVDMCEVIKTKVGTVRLNDFNLGVLLTIVGGSWFGTNARENVAVGLEHVPTWLMICYASVTEASFKRSTLGKLVESAARGNLGQMFVRSIDDMLETKKLLNPDQ